jgi:uncharacterized protein
LTTVSARPKPTVWHRVTRETAIVGRWLHIYLSMISFGVVLFFAVTGLTLNHTEWFDSQQKTITTNGVMEPAPLKQPDKLAVVEQLRKLPGVHGAVDSVIVDEDQITVSFKGAGYSADAAIQRKDGSYTLVETRSGFVAVMNDLHKGRDTGAVWSWVIDISAVLLTLVSLTGLVLILLLYKRRTKGLLTLAAGAIVAILLWRFFVP